jgi:initiation factor 1A
MPKNKRGKNNKNKNHDAIKRKLTMPDNQGQVYGFLEKALGNRFFDVRCLDGMLRRCKVRKKRMKVKQGDCCIISLRDFDDKNADVIHRYTEDEVRDLKKMNELPNSCGNILIDNMSVDNLEDDLPFDFENI